MDAERFTSSSCNTAQCTRAVSLESIKTFESVKECLVSMALKKKKKKEKKKKKKKNVR